MTTQAETLPQYDMNINGERQQPMYLRRELEAAPSLAQPKHPHGLNPSNHAHSSTAQARYMSLGNDNSSVNRQSRVQKPRPDPVPGEPYAGVESQRMGTDILKRVQGSGTMSNKSVPADPGTVTSQPPNSFQKPRDRFDTGLKQIQSQHHNDFLPPMPRPPLFSAW